MLLAASLIIGVDSFVEGAAPAIQLDSMFRNGAVLQLGVPVRIWGNASTPAGQSFDVLLDGEVVAHGTVEMTSSPHGGRSWQASLPVRHEASWGSTLEVALDTSPSDSATVLYGQVVLCSGQSNMGMPVAPYKDGAFAAANGTAEAAASGRYTNKIKLLTLQPPFPRPNMRPWNGTSCGAPNGPIQPPDCVPAPTWNDVLPGPGGTVHGFSAVCWYTGRSLFDNLGGEQPVGLMQGAVGGSAIEFWLPPGDVNTSAACGRDDPPCDTNHNLTDSQFFERLIRPLQPYTLGGVVWDQGERDVHCFSAQGTLLSHTSRYPCLERRLISSWREGFRSNFSFIAVQLPGYIGDCDGNGLSPFVPACVPGVFEMRLAQEAGTVGDPHAQVTVTYDHGCPFGVKTELCPFGSVHNVDKAPIGARVARQLQRLLPRSPDALAASLAAVVGPRVQAVSAAATAAGHRVTVEFGTEIVLRPTANCAVCCDPSASVGDFDVSADGGATWLNGSMAALVLPSSVRFDVASAQRPTHVRYTANQGFPQCAVVNAGGFLPAFPFKRAVSAPDEDARVPGPTQTSLLDGTALPRPPCNADTSCDLASSSAWRCGHDASLVPSAENNCHLAGPGTVGNSTCSCGITQCGSSPSSPTNASQLQYLMIGDSVSMGAQPHVFSNLSTHGIEGTHNPGNAASSNLGARCLDAWTLGGRRRWDAVSFQFGLHDIAYDTERVSVAQYTALLENITSRLAALQRRDATKLLWVTTTPVPTVPTYSAQGPCNITSKCLNPPRFDADVQLYNEVAAKVIAAANAAGATIATLDLYELVLNRCGGPGYMSCDGFQLPSNVHYTEAGWQALAAATVEKVLGLLAGVHAHHRQDESAVVAREAAAGVVGEVQMAAIVEVTAATGPTATAAS